MEPGLALLRKKVSENWTEKHRNVARKLFLEGGWTQKRLFDIDWSDTSQCQACKKRKEKVKKSVLSQELEMQTCGSCKGTPYEEKEKMTKMERFVTEGNEKADELAKAGAMLDEGFMAEARAETLKKEREEVCVAVQCAASFHRFVEEWKDCEEHRPKP